MYSMSDEELAKADFDQFITDEDEVSEDEEQQPEPEEDETESEAGNAEPEIDDEVDEPTDEETAPEDEDEDSADPDEANVFDNATEDSTQEDADEETAKDTEEDEAAEDTDNSDVEELKKFYEEITSEFKANGRMMSITNPSDIKALMQQGINYSKRMAELKPSMGILRTLEQHGLMDNDKISYLIDLHNKDPKAIAKLVKDSGVEAYDLENEDTEDYVPVNKVQEETKFQAVVNELKTSPKFNELLNTIATSWDTESMQFIVSNPNVLRVFEKQLDSGDFDKIMKTVEYERLCGRLQDVSMIEAYSAVENQLSVGATPSKPAEKKPAFTAPRPKPVTKSNNSKKRKVASPNANPNEQVSSFDPLTASDEEIMRIAELHKLY